jgi:hypothetical protein
MLNYINYVLKKTNLTDDIIILITNELYKKKWNTLKTKTKVRMNALSFQVINELSVDNVKQLIKPNNKNENNKPSLFKNISVLHTNRHNYKIIVFENDNTSNKYITYYHNSAVIWINNCPPCYIIYNIK